MLISKTTFLQFQMCPKDTWLKLHKPELLALFKPSHFELHLMEQGNEVEAWARKLFPAGRCITATEDEACRETQRLMAAKTDAIFHNIPRLLCARHHAGRHASCRAVQERRLQMTKHEPDRTIIALARSLFTRRENWTPAHLAADMNGDEVDLTSDEAIAFSPFGALLRAAYELGDYYFWPAAQNACVTHLGHSRVSLDGIGHRAALAVFDNCLARHGARR
jgi:hypothetical protein